MSFAKWARRYAEIGLPVFPLEPRSKIPYPGSRGFKDATVDPESVAEAWSEKPASNIGIAVPDGYVVVDVDNEAAMMALRAQDVDLPATVTARTAHGWHFWYRSAPNEFAPKVNVFPGIDIRAAGSYVVAPPSIHPEGPKYRWEVPPRTESFAVRPDWLSVIARTDECETKEPIKPEEILQGVDEGSRDVNIFRYCCKLVAENRPLAEVYVLAEYAAKNSRPPFPIAQVRAKVLSAWKYHQEVEKAEGPKLWRADEFLRTDFPEPRWFVDQVLPEGLTLITSPAKVGKSFLMGAVAYAISVGGFALGHFKAARSGVLYLDLEQSEAAAKARWLRIMDVDEGGSPPASLRFMFTWPRMGQGGVKALDELLSNEPTVGVVIVDVLSMIWPLEGQRGVNAYHQEYEVLSRLKKLAKRWSIALVLVHHTNRGSHEDRLNTVSGTNAMVGVPDALWLLSRDRGKTMGKLYITGRSVREREERLEWSPEACTWVIEPPVEQENFYEAAS